MPDTECTMVHLGVTKSSNSPKTNLLSTNTCKQDTGDKGVQSELQIPTVDTIKVLLLIKSSLH